MKRPKHILTLAFVVMLLAGCKPDEKTLGDPPSKLEGINDTFTLVEVIMVDNLTSKTDNELDVTDGFIGTDVPTIAFNSGDFTFAYNPGDSPDYLGATGTWAFDDNEFPTKINMDANGDLYELALLHTIRPQDNFLEVMLDRSCNGTGYASYKFKFQRN